MRNIDIGVDPAYTVFNDADEGRREKTMRSAVVAFVIAFVVVLLFGGVMARGFGTRVMRLGNSNSQSADARSTSSPVVGAFHSVQANGPINVKVVGGEVDSLTFHARPNVLPLLTAEVKDGVLTIGINDTGMDDIGEITATIVCPEIDGVTLNGSGNIEVNGVKSPTFEGMINGSGNLTANGAADSASFSIAGSGDIEASELHATTTKVNIAGSGNANVNASKKLDASVAGSGDVRYSGKPTDVHQNVVGSGSVSSQGD
ncbi:MAG: head GIN domain-containing protein [Fimbriimonadaceae bacterium]